MYSVVLMMALSGGTDAVECGRHRGQGGCAGGAPVSSCAAPAPCAPPVMAGCGGCQGGGGMFSRIFHRNGNGGCCGSAPAPVCNVAPVSCGCSGGGGHGGLLRGGLFHRRNGGGGCMGGGYVGGGCVGGAPAFDYGNGCAGGVPYSAPSMAPMPPAPMPTPAPAPAKTTSTRVAAPVFARGNAVVPARVGTAVPAATYGQPVAVLVRR